MDVLGVVLVEEEDWGATGGRVSAPINNEYGMMLCINNPCRRVYRPIYTGQSIL